MSNDELLQIQYLPCEIRYLQNEIKRIPDLRKIVDAHPAVDELLDILKMRLERCQAEYDRGMQFIQIIPDPWTRKLFELRYVAGYGWPTVALKMNLLEDTVKKMAQRYLKRCNGV